MHAEDFPEIPIHGTFSLTSFALHKSIPQGFLSDFLKRTKHSKSYTFLVSYACFWVSYYFCSYASLELHKTRRNSCAFFSAARAQIQKLVHANTKPHIKTSDFACFVNFLGNRRRIFKIGYFSVRAFFKYIRRSLYRYPSNLHTCNSRQPFPLAISFRIWLNMVQYIQYTNAYCWNECSTRTQWILAIAGSAAYLSFATQNILDPRIHRLIMASWPPFLGWIHSGTAPITEEQPPSGGFAPGPAAPKEATTPAVRLGGGDPGDPGDPDVGMDGRLRGS